MLRYVVLHHVGHGPPHFDLMLERDADGPLRTFRVAAWPVVGRQAVVPLTDHRRVYLTFEGDVSGGRGRVWRVEGGSVAIASDGGTTRFRFRALEVNGAVRAEDVFDLVLEVEEDGKWVLRQG